MLEKVNDYLAENNGKQISARTIADDLKYLELKKFAPIVTIKRSKEVFYTYEEDFELNKPIITTDEIFSLIMANQVLKSLKGFSLSKDLEKITTKLQHQIEEYKDEQIIFFEESPALKNIHLLQDLFESIKEKTVVKIVYQSFNVDESIEKIIHPYLLKQYNQRWFLFGYDAENNRLDNSPLDRIISIKSTRISFDSKMMAEAKVFFDDIVGVTKKVGDKPQEILFKVAKHRADYVATKAIHSSQTLHKQLKNGVKVFSINVVPNKELESYFLSFGKDLEIMKPKNLFS